ncbi:thiamin pyrophosphokinase 1 isoform X2 [Bradysia coprophila]|uniref:thiamin pyrophosphokinase 1 isoform X2 n=1 Tax=Bradysia coprophila TaxID=38358 RepID=UPI00187D819C|nr:thiamin pyrophosphokinase 1 isoform X2 [Bradysia coprophila]
MWMSFIQKFFENVLFRQDVNPRMEPPTKSKVWTPSEFLDSTVSESTEANHAIVVLNRSIDLKPTHTKQLWDRAKCRCLVDGGANQWLEFLRKNPDLITAEYPELVTGDFDSITDSTMAHFKRSPTTNVIHTPNQDHTDFTKSLMELSPYIQSDNIGSVVALLDTSGRIDHIFAHISTLVKAQGFLDNVNIFILSRDSISWLLNVGSHVIHIPQDFVDQQFWCSFVPIDGKCCVSTTGLKWNLDNQFTQFGGIVSTSNTYSSNVVTLQSDGLLYWSMGITNEES